MLRLRMTIELALLRVTLRVCGRRIARLTRHTDPPSHSRVYRSNPMGMPPLRR